MAITNFPPFPATQAVSGTLNVGNWPTVQSVSGTLSISNFPSTQTVAGSVAISNFPALQPVVLSGSSRCWPPSPRVAARRFGVDRRSGHRLRLDHQSGDERVDFEPADDPAGLRHRVDRQFPGLSDAPAFPSSFAVSNDTSHPIPVAIVSGAAGGGGTSFDGIIRNASSQAVPVQIIGGQSTFSGSLAAGTAHIGNVALDAPVQISGTVPVSLASVPTHAVTISGTPTVALASNLVTVSGRVAADVIFPATQTVSGTVALASNAVTATIAGIPTVQVANPQTHVSIDGVPTVALASNAVSATLVGVPSVQIANPVTHVGSMALRPSSSRTPSRASPSHRFRRYRSLAPRLSPWPRTPSRSRRSRGHPGEQCRHRLGYGHCERRVPGYPAGRR